MINKENILTSAKNTILSESEAIAKLADLLDDNFVKAVEIIYNSNARLVVTGIGKSAIIAQKIVATLNSTGTPSLFLHALRHIPAPVYAQKPVPEFPRHDLYSGRTNWQGNVIHPYNSGTTTP